MLTFLCLFQTQRRQQKQGTKLPLDLLTNQEEDAPLEAGSPSMNEQLETESQSAPLEQNQETSADEAVDEAQEAQKATSNRFISLSEEGTENWRVEEDEHEEAQLIKSVRTLSISEEPKDKEVDPEVESGAESEPELGPGFVVVNADPKAAFSTLSNRAVLNTSESSVESSLHQFTQVEQLTDTNRLLCVTCSRSAAHGTHTHTPK